MVSPATTQREEFKKPGVVASWKPGGGGDAKELITVKKVKRDRDRPTDFEIPDVSFKTILNDEDEAIDFAHAIHYCLEFEIDDLFNEITTLLALKASVNGVSRQQFLSAVTGVIWDFNKKKGLFDTRKDQKEKGLYNGPPTS